MIAATIGLHPEINGELATLRRCTTIKIGAMEKREVSLRDAMRIAIEVKTRAQRRPVTLKTMRGILGRFIKGREDQSAREVLTVDNIEVWLAQFDNSKTKLGYLGYLGSMCGVLWRKGLLEVNPCRMLEPITSDLHPPAILDVAQSARLLSMARNTKYLAYITLGLLGGLRPSEAQRMTYEDLDLVQGRAMVSAHTKVRRWRIVTLRDNAVEWLRLAKKTGSQLPVKNMWHVSIANKMTAEVMGGKLVQDVLRHSFASFAIADIQDAGKVAHEMGNSVGVLMRNYRNIVTREQAAAFFAIHPPPTETPQMELRL